MSFSSTTPASGDLTGICSPDFARRVLLVGDAEMLELLLGAADLGLDDVEGLLGRDAVGARALRFLLGQRLVGQQARGALVGLHRQLQLRLRLPALGHGLAIGRPGLVDERADHVRQLLAGADAIADLDEDLEDLAVDLRPDARRAPLVERQDARRFELIAPRDGGDRRHDEARLLRGASRVSATVPSGAFAGADSGAAGAGARKRK